MTPPTRALTGAARSDAVRVTPQLTSHHRRTVEKIFEIFAHPTGGNPEWRQVESLLAAIGRVESDGNGKLHIRVGPHAEVVMAPHAKDASPDGG